MPSLKGIAVSPGIALGRALVVGRFEHSIPHYKLAPESVHGELRRFWTARRRCREEIRALRDQAHEAMGSKYAAIFEAHALILEDRVLGREVLDRIKNQRMNAEWAVASSLGKRAEKLSAVDDPVLRERGDDIQDVYDRLLRALAGEENVHHRTLELAEDTIVVAAGLSPSDALWLSQPRIVGFITEQGGPTSHTAILANALEIPAILGCVGATSEIRDGEQVVVDGIHGTVVPRPSEDVAASYRRKREAYRESGRRSEAERGPIVSSDGVELHVRANIEFPVEIRTVERVGAQGVGLYRSEFLFLSCEPELPTEAQHLAAYREIVSAAKPHPVTIRTLDLGGEKYFSKVLEGGEPNPVLGLRAVRFCLERPDIFRTQLRALLRVAAEFGDVSILVPMVSGLEEWRTVLRFVATVRAELEDEGIAVPRVPLGPMIEIPGAALVADHLARESDFFSIGTNDLIQYTLAVDRGNTRVANLYDPWHPAVLRLLQRTIEAAAAAGIPVSLCGEMASDPLGALTLLGLGLREYSVNPLSVADIRALLRRASVFDARDAVEAALRLPDGAGIRAYLAERFARYVAAPRPRPGGPTVPASRTRRKESR